MRNPVQASQDPAYRHVARRLDASEILVHLRYASTGGVSLVNTHPFSQDGRLFAEYELYSLNFVLADLGHIWAFRYPEHHPLHLHRRRRGGPSGDAPLEEADAAGTLRLHSDDGVVAPLVVIASERISDEPGWEEIDAGELVHVGPDLEVDRETIVSAPPAHPMRLSAHEEQTQSYD
jgi:predicted glutamine amidotransferase